MFVHRIRYASCAACGAAAAKSDWRRARSALLAIIALAVVVIGCGPRGARASANPTTAPAAIEYNSDADAGTAVVSGTSTLHDWTAKSTTINGTVQCSGPWTGAAPKLQSIQLTIPVNSLKSSEGSGMDKTMYDALKMNANPLITYTLNSASLKSPPSKDDPKYHYEAIGQLAFAGATRVENLTLDIQPGDGGKATIDTQIQLKMTDFGMEPPTGMMGMIRSGDEVTVKVTWQLTMRGQ